METGEILIGASVFDKISGQGTVTNYQGFYTLSLETQSLPLAPLS